MESAVAMMETMKVSEVPAVQSQSPPPYESKAGYRLRMTPSRSQRRLKTPKPAPKPEVACVKPRLSLKREFSFSTVPIKVASPVTSSESDSVSSTYEDTRSMIDDIFGCSETGNTPKVKSDASSSWGLTRNAGESTIVADDDDSDDDDVIVETAIAVFKESPVSSSTSVPFLDDRCYTSVVNSSSTGNGVKGRRRSKRRSAGHSLYKSPEAAHSLQRVESPISVISTPPPMTEKLASSPESIFDASEDEGDAAVSATAESISTITLSDSDETKDRESKEEDKSGPASELDRLTLSEALESLADGELLNDSAIMLMLELCVPSSLTSHCFLIPQIVTEIRMRNRGKKAKELLYEQLVRAGCLDSEMKYVLVPVCENVHWCLVVVDIENQQFLHMDSLQCTCSSASYIIQCLRPAMREKYGKVGRL